MKLVIVSPNEVFLDRCKEYFTKCPDVEIRKGFIQEVKREGAAFVSPANSLGFMDGGVDMVLSREMFPGCEKEVKKKIAELGYQTLLGRPYLRVGSALWVPCGNNTVLISAPTMFLPHPIPFTQNVYWAMQAALVCVQKIPVSFGIDTLVITSMGCGVGCMDPEAAALQIRDAWREYEEGSLPAEVENRGDSYALLESHDHAQPSNYDNREIGVPWPAGWLPAAVGPTGPLKQISITPSVTQKTRGPAVCYDA